MAGKVFFISGIDTDCGKTYITGHIARNLKHSGINAITQKLVQTGNQGISEDIIEHRKIMGIELLPEDNDGVTCPYVFKFPASPHLAAKLENKNIDLNKLKSATKLLAEKFEIVLCEGAGGLHVPISGQTKVIDYIRENNYPLILVSSSKLGSINHTLLTLETCLTNNINLHSVVYNEFPDHDKVISNESFAVISEFMSLHFPTSGFSKLKDYDFLKLVTSW